MAARATSRVTGLAIALAGGLGASPDAVLLRLAQRSATENFNPSIFNFWADGPDHDETLMQVLFWKHVFVFATTLAAVSWWEGGITQLMSKMSKGPGYIAVGTMFQASMTVCISISLMLGESTASLMGLSLQPLWAGLLGVCINSDRLSAVTWITIAVSVFAVLLDGVLTLLMPEAEAAAAGGGDLQSAWVGRLLGTLPCTAATRLECRGAGGILDTH